MPITSYRPITVLIFTVLVCITGIFTFSYFASAQSIADGDLVTTADSFDIYIVKLVGAKKFTRLILNPDIFNSYGHLKWENVKTVSQSTISAYTLSELVIEVNADGSIADPKVYRVRSDANSDVGERRWLNISASEFESLGYDWDSLYHVNHTEASPDFYPTKDPLTFEALKPAQQEIEEPKEIEEAEKIEEPKKPTIAGCDNEVPTTHATIQAAIDAAQSGDKVCVLAGTYEENIKIDGKDIVLVGAGINSTFIKAVRDSEDPDTVNPEKNSTIVIKNVSSAMQIEKFTIKNGNYYGIWLNDASPKIQNNIIADNYAGIRILGNSRPTIQYNLFSRNSHGNTIVHNGNVGGYEIDHNTFANNGNSGGSATIRIDSSPSNAPITISNNVFVNGVIGVYEASASNFLIQSNLFHNQSEGNVRRFYSIYNSAVSINNLGIANGNLVANPLLEVDYSPKPNSPVLGAADDSDNIGAY